MSKLPVYARFLHILNNIKQETQDSAFEGCEEVLAFIAVRNHSGADAKITDLVQSLQFGTGPTVHRKVSTLVQRGYITMERSAKDTRAKILRISESGNHYLRDRSKMLKAIFEGQA